MLAPFPLITAKIRHWWSHCRSLGSPDLPTSFFPRPLIKRWWTCHKHQWSQLRLVESSNYWGYCIFGILQPLNICCCSACLTGTVCRCPQLLCPIPYSSLYFNSRWYHNDTCFIWYSFSNTFHFWWISHRVIKATYLDLSITTFTCQATVRQNETAHSDVIEPFGLHVCWSHSRVADVSVNIYCAG